MITFGFWLALLVQGLITAQATPPATIRGKIANSQTGAALQDAKISVAPPGRGLAIAARSDAAGNYEIRVEPGLYNVAVEKEGFVWTQYLDVANVPVVQVGAGRAETVDFSLIPGATIEGTVTDASGAPIPRAGVQALVRIYYQGKVEYRQRAGVPTNERGQYRIANLPAGNYDVQASKTGVAGAGVRTFVPIIHSAAVAAGESKRNIDFRLPDATSYSVSGRITFLANGQPAPNMEISIYPNSGANDASVGMTAKTHTRADGTFHVEGLTPGGYRMEGRLIGDEHGSPSGFFQKFVEVPAADVTNVNIRVDRGATLKGRLRAAGATLPEGITVRALVRNPLGGAGYWVPATSASVGGTFEIRNVPPETCNLVITIEGLREFFVAAVTVDGKDVTESGIRVPESPAIVEALVTVDFRPGTVTGKTLDFEGKPIPGAYVTLMSSDPTKRLLPAYSTEIMSDREGAFRFGALVPGDYLLMIWPGHRTWDGLDPEAFGILEKHATRVKVEQSGTVTLNLQWTREVRDLLDAL